MNSISDIVISQIKILGFRVSSLVCISVCCVRSSFAVISLGKRELVALLLLCSECHVAVIVI